MAVKPWLKLWLVQDSRSTETIAVSVNKATDSESPALVINMDLFYDTAVTQT